MPRGASVSSVTAGVLHVKRRIQRQFVTLFDIGQVPLVVGRNIDRVVRQLRRTARQSPDTS